MRIVSQAALLVSCLTALITLASGQLASDRPPQDEDVKAVRNLNDQETQAFLNRDAATLAQLWSDEFVVTNPLNKLVNKQQVLNMVQSGFLVITSYTREIEYARSYGDIIIVAGNEKVTWGGGMPNAGRVEALRFTAVWRNEQGRWQEIARHANIVPAK
jgi:uncharacterized protein (TIGR02246 family)